MIMKPSQIAKLITEDVKVNNGMSEQNESGFMDSPTSDSKYSVFEFEIFFDTDPETAVYCVFFVESTDKREAENILRKWFSSEHDNFAGGVGGRVGTVWHQGYAETIGPAAINDPNTYVLDKNGRQVYPDTISEDIDMNNENNSKVNNGIILSEGRLNFYYDDSIEYKNRYPELDKMHQTLLKYGYKINGEHTNIIRYQEEHKYLMAPYADGGSSYSEFLPYSNPILGNLGGRINIIIKTGVVKISNSKMSQSEVGVGIDGVLKAIKLLRSSGVPAGSALAGYEAEKAQRYPNGAPGDELSAAEEKIDVPDGYVKCYGCNGTGHAGPLGDTCTKCEGSGLYDGRP